MNVNVNEARDLILSTNGLLSLEFVKRTTGESRIMVCTVNPVQHSSKSRYDPREKGLIVVVDEQKGALRSVPLDSIKSVTVRGVTFVVG
jgi:hypothetical protein